MHVNDASDQCGCTELGSVGCVAHVGCSSEKLLQRNAQFHASQVGTHAKMVADAECEVGCVSIDIEGIGILEDAGVTVGGSVDHQNPLSLLDRYALKLRIASRGAREGDDRRRQSQHFLDRARDQGRVLD